MRDYMATMRIVLGDYAFAPVRAHEDDAGLDLRSPFDEVVPARGSCVIDTHVHVELQRGTVGFLKSKSGLNVDHGIVSEGVIDCGYTGSIRVKLYNHSDEDYHVRAGDKISQLVILRYESPQLILVNKLHETERGDGGFGSTGR